MSTGDELFSLEGKTALVTGATGHLGTAMAFALGKAGARVLVNSRSSTRAESLVARLLADGLEAEAACFDITSAVEVSAFAARQVGRPLHVLVNNAYAGGAGTIELTAAESYAASYDVTVVAAHRLLTAMLPNLRAAVVERGEASVINLASMYGLVSPDQRIYDSPSGANPPFYGAAKAALLQWTRYAACELGRERIRVNAVSPGPFPSEDVRAANPLFVDQLARKVPLGRVGDAPEMQGPVLFLASAASSFVNGANLVVDGGWTCW